MKTITNPNRGSPRKPWLWAALLVLGLALALAPAAYADHGNGNRGRGGQGNGHQWQGSHGGGQAEASRGRGYDGRGYQGRDGQGGGYQERGWQGRGYQDRGWQGRGYHDRGGREYQGWQGRAPQSWGFQGRGYRHGVPMFRRWVPGFRGQLCFYPHRVYAYRGFYRAPSVVYLASGPFYPEPLAAVAPWWVGAPQIDIEGTPYFFNARLGFYIGGAAIQLNLGNVPPAGCVYYDPYSQEVYPSLDAYQQEWRDDGNPQALTIAYVGQ